MMVRYITFAPNLKPQTKFTPPFGSKKHRMGKKPSTAGSSRSLGRVTYWLPGTWAGGKFK